MLEPAGERLLPDAPLAVSQKAVPLEVPIDRLGGRALGREVRVALGSIEVGGRTLSIGARRHESFAPAQFVDMNDAERLAAPAFEALVSGAAFGAVDDVDAGASVAVPTAREFVVVDAEERSDASVGHPPRTALGHRETPPSNEALYGVRDEGWVARGPGVIGTGPRTSWSAARAGGAPVARAAETRAPA